jgi:mannosyltransferase OCH1-like enzyme
MLFLVICILFIIIVLYIYLKPEYFTRNLIYKAKYTQKIPFIICATHENLACQNHLESIKTLNPEYTFYFFDEKARIQYIQDYFSSKVLDAYLKLIPGAFKADLFRYCFLFHHGGVYMDLNKKLVISLREIVFSKASLGLVLNSNHQLSENPKIINGFIYIVPQHRLMKECIDQCVSNIENNFYGDSHLSVTGPYMFGQVFSRIFNKSLFSLGYGLHFHEETVIHVMKYIENDQILDVLTGKKVVSFPERHSCKTTFPIQQYTTLWQQKKIYKGTNLKS